MADDIKGVTPEPEVSTPAPRHRSVGPESEDRGGSEAPDQALGDDDQGETGMPDGMPGQRAGLPEGSLSTPFLGAQGDENREPPADAPAPVQPAPTVKTISRD